MLEDDNRLPKLKLAGIPFVVAVQDMSSVLGKVNMIFTLCYTCLLYNHWSMNYTIFCIRKKNQKLLIFVWEEKWYTSTERAIMGKDNVWRLWQAPVWESQQRHPWVSKARPCSLQLPGPGNDGVKWPCDQSCPRWAEFCCTHQVREWGGCKAINRKRKVRYLAWGTSKFREPEWAAEQIDQTPCYPGVLSCISPTVISTLLAKFLNIS